MASILQQRQHQRAAPAVQQQQQHVLQLLPCCSRRGSLALQANACSRIQVAPAPSSSSVSSSSSCTHRRRFHNQHLQQLCLRGHHERQQPEHAATGSRRHAGTTAAAAAAAGAAAYPGDSSSSSSSSSPEELRAQGAGEQQQPPSSSTKAVPPRIMATTDEETYSLRDTQVLVETAMLSAVSGLAFLLSTLLKLDNSLGYFLPLPITIAACRSGAAAGWHTMMATAFLLLVLLGPLRATTYVLMHGVLAASLGSMWLWNWPWQASILAGAILRMSGQLAYLVLSSLTMNENLFSVMLANVHNLLDQLYAALGSYGSTSTLTIACMIFALLLVNGICYVFLLHVIYHVILSSMGFKLGAVPRFVRGLLSAGTPRQQQQQ